MKENILEVKNISKSFQMEQGRKTVLEDISFSASKDDAISILGHSGCGKTTLLRILCGLEGQDAGEIFLEGEPFIHASKEILMLFQNFNQLLPWKKILANIVHPMRAAGIEKKRNKARETALKLLREVGLEDYGNSYPCQLSGGMKQRAAVVRALALKPKVLVMDEPFASLDYATRRKLQQITKDECRKNGVTLIFVTHDVEEAIVMANRIIIMDANPGKIQAILDNPYYRTESETDKMKAMNTIYAALG